jgi:hypothetical protein
MWKCADSTFYSLSFDFVWILLALGNNDLREGQRIFTIDCPKVQLKKDTYFRIHFNLKFSAKFARKPREILIEISTKNFHFFKKKLKFEMIES